jgi:hypothetical protein
MRIPLPRPQAIVRRPAGWGSGAARWAEVAIRAGCGLCAELNLVLNHGPGSAILLTVVRQRLVRCEWR